jgi:hypothetical protein
MTSTKACCCPDFLLWLNNVLLFWGEEKSVSGAKEDIERKIEEIDPVFFGNIQFMICYAVDGPKIRFYAVDGSSKVNGLTPLTQSLNMTNILDRFSILSTVINIARILMTVKHLIPAAVYPLAKKRKYRDTEISFNAKDVEKKVLITALPYCSTDPTSRIDFLTDMYKHAKNHRGLVQYKKVPTLNAAGTHYKVVLKTRGFQVIPKNEAEVQTMVKDLVSGLDRLHSRYLHRDIRLPNILYDPTIKQYVLIDFEHGGRASRGRKSRGYAVDDKALTGWDHGTLDRGAYTAMSEMYQLGNLLRKEFSKLIISDQGVDFVAKLINKKMTAKKALEHEWIHNIR